MGREIYLTPALVTVAACTLGAYLIWRQGVTTQVRPSNNNEIGVIARNRRTQTVAENKAAETSTRKSVEEHSKLKISAHCKTSVGELYITEKPNVSEPDGQHGFSEVSKELKEPVKEAIIRTQEVMAENFGLINEVSSSESIAVSCSDSNEALNDHKVTLLDLRQISEPINEVTPPDPSHNIGSENEVPDDELNNRNVITSNSLKNLGSKSEVYFNVNENSNYSTIALRDSSPSSGSEIEASDSESNITVCNKTLEQAKSEEDNARQEVTLPDPSLNFGSVNKLPDHESNRTINNIAVVSENSGSVNQVSACINNETKDNQNVTLKDLTQTSGSKNEVNNSESNDNAINNSVSHSDEIQRLQGIVGLTRHTEENLNEMDYNRKRWRRNPMYIALKEGNLTLVQSLLRKGASMDFNDRQGQTPAHLAAGSGNIALLEMLVGWGGDLSRRDLFGYTPFHRAALCGQTETIKWLYERGGGYIMERSWAGWTALHLAAISGHYTTALQLLQFGADVNAKDKDGWTPLYLAKLYKRVAVMKLLQSWGGTL